MYGASVGLGLVRADICYTEQCMCMGEEDAISDAVKEVYQTSKTAKKQEKKKERLLI
jgi:hypothetical protein